MKGIERVCMRTQVLEGNKQQIAQQVTKLVGDVVRAHRFR